MKKQVITAVAILDQIDALIEERAQVMMIEARAIVEAFDIQTNLRRRGDKARRPKYAVRVKRSTAGVQIHWHAYRLERHHKQGKWLLRQDFIKRGAGTHRYALGRFPHADDWEMEYIRDIENKAVALREETTRYVNLKRAMNSVNPPNRKTPKES